MTQLVHARSKENSLVWNACELCQTWFMIGWKLSKFYPCNTLFLPFGFYSSKGLGVGHPNTESWISVVDPPPEFSTTALFPPDFLSIRNGCKACDLEAKPTTWKNPSLLMPFADKDTMFLFGWPIYTEVLVIGKPEVTAVTARYRRSSSVKSFLSRAVPTVPQGWNLQILNARVVWCVPAVCWAMVHYRS